MTMSNPNQGPANTEWEDARDKTGLPYREQFAVQQFRQLQLLRHIYENGSVRIAPGDIGEIVVVENVQQDE